MSSVLFGEIVEPSTRALIDEDLEEYPEYVEITPKWEGNYETPHEINSLIVIESRIVRDLLNDCILNNQKPICTLINGGIDIYSFKEKQYFVVYYEGKELNACQVVEAIEHWILKAKIIYTIKSDSIYNYQNPFLLEKPAYIIKTISNIESNLSYTKLEQPNLVTGLGAAVLSYCIHQQIPKCTLIIIYLHQSQLDSFNSWPILDVFKKMGLSIQHCTIKDRVVNMNNLYM
ncbi:uncharacterized protein LOC130441522 [Diorhabda sublineata]|uniref:uncharacterized protein LOC130441522 n=1 Tax=Diorhabda sublineata TaxID=1163346 RepID=UPI0024E13E8C|nr:uncharacterized protein LOC130441522 [Diorhabda sublineata]